MLLMVEQVLAGLLVVDRSTGIQGLDDTLDLPDACPWPTLDDLLRAAEERQAADRRRFP